LISDDVYIATSFNWLSFMGDKRRKYRTEIGEMRTLPSVVQKRFDFMMNECQKYGQPMNDSLIPR
jgi:phage-related protein